MTNRVKYFIGALAAGFLALACGPNKPAPSVPSVASAALPAEGDAVGTAPAAQPPLDTSSPFDATVAHRLQALPNNIQDQVKSCEAQGRFFNLGTQLCTDIGIAALACSINEDLKARLDPSTLAPLDEYLSTKAVAHRLYACTEEGANLTMHFYKFENGVVNYKKLNIAKKAT